MLLFIYSWYFHLNICTEASEVNQPALVPALTELPIEYVDQTLHRESFHTITR